MQQSITKIWSIMFIAGILSGDLMSVIKTKKTMSKGCNSCLHYKHGKINMWKKDDPHFCSLGKDNEFQSWWNENGSKTERMLTEMSCFEETVSGSMLNKMSEKLDEMNQIVDRKK